MTAKIKLIGFKRKGADKTALTVKIDAEVVKDLDKLEARLEALIAANVVSSEMTISRPDLIEETLKEFIEKANAEFDRLEKAGKPAEGQPNRKAQPAKPADPASTAAA